MTAELKLLAASVILGLVHLIGASHLISFQRGYRWTASSREEPVPPLRGLANRVDQVLAQKSDRCRRWNSEIQRTVVPPTPFTISTSGGFRPPAVTG